jgi:hypothetical protein
MEHFSPISAAFGGVLIGASAAFLWLALGRIAGISGIIGSLLQPSTEDNGWRIAFVVGLVVAPVLYSVGGGFVPPIVVDAPTSVVVAAGLFVGFGTRLGGGCTSGHGVCGMARLSPRSIVATLLFMTAGFASVFVARHLVGG